MLTLSRHAASHVRQMKAGDGGCILTCIGSFSLEGGCSELRRSACFWQEAESEEQALVGV